MNILVVDDDKNIVSMISDFLTINDLVAIKAYNGRQAMECLEQKEIDLIVLDVNLGETSGFDLCKKIRAHSTVPIIFLTAKIAQSDKILGLGIGGDDYLTKPFDPMELIARIKSNLRRNNKYSHSPSESSLLTHRHIEVNRTSHEVLIDGCQVELSSTEYQLLCYLIMHKDQILSRQTLLRDVWNSELYTENTVNTYIMRLRDKIEKDKNFPELLITIRGEGYILKS